MLLLQWYILLDLLYSPADGELSERNTIPAGIKRLLLRLADHEGILC